MVSKVGDDALGKELLAGLKDLNFDLSLIQIDSSNRTGTVDVVLTPDGNPSFTINPNVAYDYLELTSELLAAAQKCSFVCFGTLVQRSEQTRKTMYAVLDAAQKATKFLDINLRRNCYSAETVTESLRRTDILKLNQSEVRIISDLLELPATTSKDMAQAVMERFDVGTVLVTLGEDGVYAIDSSGRECQVRGVSITVADTIGSGDSFSAGFTFKHLQGASLEECCLFGNLMGALNATKKGGMPDISLSEVQQFVQQHS
jgi:fructokinase